MEGDGSEREMEYYREELEAREETEGEEREKEWRRRVGGWERR